MPSDTLLAGSAQPTPVPARSTARRWAVLLGLLLSSAAMVYGTWLAADDVMAKPLAAHVTLDGDTLVVVNDNAFIWRTTRLTLNDAFAAEAATAVEPGATLRLPLGVFVDGTGRTLAAAGQTAADVTIVASRRARFGAVNQADRTSSGRWPLR